MKLDVQVTAGAPEVVLSEVYSGVGIKTDMGLFGIAQRDGGIEVMLDGKIVWTSHELVLRSDGPGVRLPDGSGAFVASFPLPKDHWLYASDPNESPMPMRKGNGPFRDQCAANIRDAARYAIRASTMNGKETNFDPDALVRNLIVGMLGYWTESGRR